MEKTITNNKLNITELKTQEDYKQALWMAFPELKKASAIEMGMALATCKKHNLNPFLKEIYLVRMKDKVAPIVNYLSLVNKVRAKYPNIQEKWEYKKDDNFNLIAVQITLLNNNEPMISQIVHMNEYKQDNAIWRSKPNTMLQKVARAQAYRLVDSEFQDLYIREEMPGKEITPNTTPKPIQEVEQENVISEDELKAIAEWEIENNEK